MSFDFEAAVEAPFRMQPGLRRLQPGAPQLTPMTPGSRHQREKLAVLSRYARQALLVRDGFDPEPALHALCAEAAATQPLAWRWDGQVANATVLGTTVTADGAVQQTGTGSFGLGDEVSRCLLQLPPTWRLTGLLCLAFEEDFALLDGSDASIPWLAVTLPSHWAPETKVGQHFTAVHAPVADNQMLLKASTSLVRLVCGGERWERFVWTVADQPRLHAHPDRTDPVRWQQTAVADAWWRTEHQTFVPLPALNLAVFTIHVQVQPLAQVLQACSPGRPARAQALHDAIASMSPAVLEYRGLQRVRQPLLHWLTGFTGLAAVATAP